MRNRLAAPLKCGARQWHSSGWEDRAIRQRAATVARFDALDGERSFSAENLHTISTDTHIDDFVITLGGANKNAAGTVHFQALLDQNPLLAGNHAVRHHPGGAASGGGPGGRIVSVVKDHAGVEAGFRVDGFAANKVEELPAAQREIFAATVDIEAEALQRLQRTQRSDGERNTGRDGLDGRGVVEVGGAQARDPRDGLHVMDRAELGILLRHFSKGGLRWFLGETHRYGADVQIEADFFCLCATLATQNERGAERWM